jgi:hypothetical protein
MGHFIETKTNETRSFKQFCHTAFAWVLLKTAEGSQQGNKSQRAYKKTLFCQDHIHHT